MPKKKQLNEIAPIVGAAGGMALRAVAKPLLKYAGKKLFKKAAKAGIKKFGKSAVKSAVNTTKELAKNKAVRGAVKNIANKGIENIKKKFNKQQTSNQPTSETPETIKENFSSERWNKLVKRVLSYKK